VLVFTNGFLKNIANPIEIKVEAVLWLVITVNYKVVKSRSCMVKAFVINYLPYCERAVFKFWGK
jgi:hypothetical protein